MALVYGVYLFDLETASWKELGDGTYGLTVAQMKWIWDGYLHGSDTSPTDPRIAPAHADLSGLPNTWVMCGDLDPLIDDSRVLIENLKKCQVEYIFKVEEGVTHFVWMWQRIYKRSRNSISEGAGFLKTNLRKS